MTQNKFTLFFSTNWKQKVVSLLLSVCVIGLINYAGLRTREVTIPLEVTLPSSYVAESLVPSTVVLNIHGKENIIYLVNPDTIKATSDFSQVDQEGIATKPVILDYSSDIFNKGEIVLNTEPRVCRIKFSKVDTE